ncbi:MAG: membrane protein insertase YidC [Gallionellaceae bacterium]
MDFQRLFLFLIFFLSVFMLWDSWERSKQVQTHINSSAAPSISSVSSPIAIVPDSTASGTANVISEPTKRQSGHTITVTTDWLIAEINSVGGDIRRLELLQQHSAKDKDKPFVLMQEQEGTYIAQSGLLGNGLPTHNAIFSSDANNYRLAEGQDELEVRLQATDVVGAKVTKVYTFHRGSYLIDVGYKIVNDGKDPLVSSAYFQLVRDKTPPAGTTKFVSTYTGPAIYTDQEKFQKVNFADIDKGKAKFPAKSDNGWIGIVQHYFVAAWLPQEKSQHEFYIKPLGNDLYSVGVVVPVPTAAPGQSITVNVPLYAGPATNSLDKIAPGLGLTVDYGWLTILSVPLFWLLSHIESWVHNWGIAIILLTVFIKLLFFPLSAASYRSMAKMKVVAPKLEKIKSQYGEDRERLHKAMMELYKTEKINPLGGCLPMVIQIPVFIALYWAILSSVELRYAPFFGWIDNLSAPDPYYILPLIMGASMVLQSRLSPPPPDPMQAKVMKMMPVIFSVVFFFFPAGLVLYSIVNSTLSIAQQWVITRNLELSAKGAAKT